MLSFLYAICRKAVPALVAVPAFLFVISCQTVTGPVREVRSDKQPSAQELYEKAEHNLQAGLYEGALPSLIKIFDSYPDYSEMAAVRADLALVYYHLKEHEKSIAVCKKWLDDYSENSEKGNISLLLGKNYWAAGNSSEAFSWFLKAKEYSVKEADSLVLELIDEGTTDNLTAMNDIDSSGIYAPWIKKQLAQLYLNEDRVQEAREAAAFLIQSAGDESLVNEGRILLEAIYRRMGEIDDVKREVIGCLLPLKGPFALFGSELLNGIQLGMDIFNRSAKNPVELVIINTNGKVKDTLDGIDTLVNEEKVIAIIGPLASKPAFAAAERAQKLGVPIITFAQTNGITGKGDMVFRNFLTPEKEVETLLKKSIEMGMKSFGIFYPDNPYGNHMMKLFWDYADKMGGSIGAVESYPPDSTDFTEGIKKMVGLYYPRPESVTRRLRATKKMREMEEKKKILNELWAPRIYETGEGEFTYSDASLFKDLMEREADSRENGENTGELEELEPIVDFDAVFIPDNHRNVAMIAPQFPFYNVFNVPFLGTSLWLSRDLVESTGIYLQGAMFPAGFFAGMESGSVETFVNDYQYGFDSTPEILAASGYDTIRLIRKILSDVNVRTRLDFQQALLEESDFSGVTGRVTFDETGEVEKSPLLLTIHGSRLHVIN